MRRIPKKTLVVPVAACALLLSACGGAPGTTTTTAAGSGGEKEQLTLGMTADFYGWDPSSQPGYQGWAAEAVWDQLCKTDVQGKAVPDAAETFEVINENKTFKATLREGMTFSDGSPVTPADVKASFEYLNEEGANNDYKGIVIDTPDERTVSITWPEPQPVMDNKACAVKLLPAAAFEARNWDTPVGSGPYVLDEANTTTGSVYAFTKNENHWDAANYPYKKLVVRVIVSETAAVSALKTGQIDATLVPQSAVAEVEGSGKEVISYQGQTTRLILSDRTGKVLPALGEVKVRQAINMVFDKEAMAKSLYQGNAEPAAQVYRKGTDAFIDGLTDPYPYDVDKAKQLMAEAGYADGLDLELPTMDGQNFDTLMPYVTQQLALINVRVKQVPLSGANAITDLLSGTYPVVLWELGNLGNSTLQTYIESTPEGWWNLQHEQNEYVDSRWEQIKTADAATTKKLLQEINQYIIDEAWFAPMVYTGKNYAYDASKVSIPTQSDQEALTPKLRDFK